MSIIFKIEEGKSIKIEIDELNNFESYNNSLTGKTFFYNNYVIKVFPLNNITENILKKFKFLNSLTIDNNLKKYIFHRSLPISFFIDVKNKLDFNKDEKLIWFIFNKVEGISLEEYLKNEPPFSQKRINILEKIIKLTNFCEKNNIIVNDIHPDNFIVDKVEDLYILDLYKSGILESSKDEIISWISEPIISIKEELFYSPEIVLNQKINKNSLNWSIVYLTFWILTNLKPFDFLNQNNHKNLEFFIFNVDKSVVTWPPLITTFQEKQRKILFPKTIKKEKYDIFKKLCDELNNEDIKGKIFELSFNTFIKGYIDHNYRYSAEQVKDSLFISSLENIKFSGFDFPSTQTKENIENLVQEKNQEEQKREEKIKKESQSIKKQETSKEKLKIIKNLPISTREYIIKIIQLLEKNKLLDEEIEKNIEEIIKKQQIDLVINVFISSRKLYEISSNEAFLNTVLWFIYIINTDHCDTFLNQLTKLSEILNVSIYKVIQLKVGPLLSLKKTQEIRENYKEILYQIQKEILKEIKKQNEKRIKNLTTIFLIIIAIISFFIPFILFFFFKIQIVYIILLYPLVFIFSIISSRILIQK